MKKLVLCAALGCATADAAVVETELRRTATTKSLTAKLEVLTPPEDYSAILPQYLEEIEDVPGCVTRHPKYLGGFLRHKNYTSIGQQYSSLLACVDWALIRGHDACQCKQYCTGATAIQGNQANKVFKYITKYLKVKFKKPISLCGL